MDQQLNDQFNPKLETSTFHSRCPFGLFGMLPRLDPSVHGRKLADVGLGVPGLIVSPPSPPHPPCLPDWDTTPGMPCHGPAPPSFELVPEDDSTKILGFAVMGLVAVIALIAVVRVRSRELHQGNNKCRQGNEVGRAWAALRDSQRGPTPRQHPHWSRDARLLNGHRSLLRLSPSTSSGWRNGSKKNASKESPCKLSQDSPRWAGWAGR